MILDGVMSSQEKGLKFRKVPFVFLENNFSHGNAVGRMSCPSLEE